MVANGERGRNILLLRVVGELPRIGRHQPNMQRPPQLQLLFLLARNYARLALILRDSNGCSQKNMVERACGNLTWLNVHVGILRNYLFANNYWYDTNSYIHWWCEDLPGILPDYICSSIKITPACGAQPFPRKQVLLYDNRATTR